MSPLLCTDPNFELVKPTTLFSAPEPSNLLVWLLLFVGQPVQQSTIFKLIILGTTIESKWTRGHCVHPSGGSVKGFEHRIGELVVAA